MQSQEKIIENLLNPSFYPHETEEEIQMIETHISWVFLTGQFVYKMKKSLKFGEILDFSNLDKRFQACKNELFFNKRLAPEIYLDVIRINENLEFSQKGEPLEYLVKMKQLPQTDLLLNRVMKKIELSKEIFINLAEKISEFHENNIINPEFSVYDNIFEKWDENFRTTRTYPDFPLNKKLEARVYDYLKKNKEFFNNRAENGKIVDGHGDLILANIFDIKGEVIIFDCIEFNEMLRIQDVLEEVAFLAMDLDFHNLNDLSNLFLDEYLSKTQSEFTSNSSIINFYKSYRAYVRAKVYYSQVLQEEPGESRNKTVELSKKYMDLASSYDF
jgi:aminoglycoside phosphotransferase family enzyme